MTTPTYSSIKRARFNYYMVLPQGVQLAPESLAVLPSRLNTTEPVRIKVSTPSRDWLKIVVAVLGSVTLVASGWAIYAYGSRNKTNETADVQPAFNPVRSNPAVNLNGMVPSTRANADVKASVALPTASAAAGNSELPMKSAETRISGIDQLEPQQKLANVATAPQQPFSRDVSSTTLVNTTLPPAIAPVPPATQQIAVPLTAAQPHAVNNGVRIVAGNRVEHHASAPIKKAPRQAPTISANVQQATVLPLTTMATMPALLPAPAVRAQNMSALPDVPKFIIASENSPQALAKPVQSGILKRPAQQEQSKPSDSPKAAVSPSKQDPSSPQKLF